MIKLDTFPRVIFMFEFINDLLNVTLQAGDTVVVATVMPLSHLSTRAATSASSRVGQLIQLGNWKNYHENVDSFNGYSFYWLVVPAATPSFSKEFDHFPRTTHTLAILPNNFRFTIQITVIGSGFSAASPPQWSLNGQTGMVIIALAALNQLIIFQFADTVSDYQGICSSRNEIIVDCDLPVLDAGEFELTITVDIQVWWRLPSQKRCLYRKSLNIIL